MMDLLTCGLNQMNEVRGHLRSNGIGLQELTAVHSRLLQASIATIILRMHQVLM